MTSAKDVFFNYAAAFEETYKDDDWERLRLFFADDAVYEVVGGPLACHIEGVDGILAGMKKSLNGLDRRMDSRKIAVRSEPEIGSYSIGLNWTVTYTRGDSPPGDLLGRSQAIVRGGVITELRDYYDESEGVAFTEWMSSHGQDLDGSYV
jgi:hypothetical protein